MLGLRRPAKQSVEVDWIVSVVLSFLGCAEVDSERVDGDSFVFHRGGRELTLPNSFLCKARSAWLSPTTLPTRPLAHWNICSSELTVDLEKASIPVLFGEPGFTLDESGNGELKLDVFGSAFFMLSRYEEVIVADRDQHDRFPSTASIAYAEGFLDRPIIDEYLEILVGAIQRVWPDFERQPRQARLLVSCDVDHPYALDGRLKGTLRRLAGDLIKRHSPILACQDLWGGWLARQGDYSRDRNFSALHWIMEVNERANNRVTFNFIAGRSHPALDGDYQLYDPVIRGLIRCISERGHDIGLHPSYNTYRDATQTAREAELLRAVMDSESVQQDSMGSRQHFLRWETPTTARNLEAVGMDYDSTLGYADRPGFRCGTSREYPMYDVVERRRLALRQRPLILMECSVIADRYMALGYTDAALELMLVLKERALRYGGDFTLLWHNSQLWNRADQRFYQELIS